jgi:FixJ family two-component response regulator
MPNEDTLIYIVDDEAEVRRSLTGLLQAAGLRVETFASAEAFLRRPQRDIPTCLVLDVWLPGLTGLDLQHAVTAGEHPMPIIFMTGHGEIPLAVQAMKAGAVEFLTKPFAAQALLDAIGEALAHDRAARQQRTDLAPLRERYARLTPREREVMAWVVAGDLNKQIASELGIGEQTVKVHRFRVMHKMQVASLPELVRAAAQLGLAVPRSTPGAGSALPRRGPQLERQRRGGAEGAQGRPPSCYCPS